MPAKKTKKATKTPLDQFDKLTSSMRVTLYLYRNPKSGITAIINGTGLDQKAVYHVTDFLEENKLLSFNKKEKPPYSPVLSLNEKGKMVAEHLAEVEKIFEQ
jgi:Transcriptional regulators